MRLGSHSGAAYQNAGKIPFAENCGRFWQETVVNLRNVLCDYTHNGFPVVRPTPVGHVFVGIVLRSHLRCEKTPHPLRRGRMYRQTWFPSPQIPPFPGPFSPLRLF
jgi:hypothetical protein